MFFVQYKVAAETRVKRQDEDDDDQTTDELCQDRPGDEYFRLSSDGDCRDVVRYVYIVMETQYKQTLPCALHTIRHNHNNTY